MSVVYSLPKGRSQEANDPEMGNIGKSKRTAPQEVRSFSSIALLINVGLMIYSFVIDQAAIFFL
jgi:hypothetical protein